MDTDMREQKTVKMFAFQLVKNMIAKENNKYIVKAKSGRIMGRYTTKTAAEERLKQVEMFKHLRKK
jgi:hypothetical protein